MWVLFLIELGSVFYILYPEKYVHWLLVLCFKHLSHVYTHFSLLSLLLFWFIYQPSWKCFLFARTHSRLTFTLRCCFVSLNEWIFVWVFVWVFVMYVIRNRFHFIKCTARFLRTSVLRSLFEMSLLSHPHIAFQISNCNCEYYMKCLTIDNSHESNCFTIYRLSMFSL